MKKRTLTAIITLLSAAVLLFTACSDKTDNVATDTTTTTTAETNAPVIGPNPEHPMMNLFDVDLTEYIKLGNYSGLDLKVSVNITEEEYESQLALEAKNNKCYLLNKDRVTAAGDTLSIDFVGTLDGVAFNGGTANNSIISLTENTGYIPGFDADLYGIMPGTTVTTNVVFPTNYQSTDLAGKAAVFSITCNGICELNEDGSYKYEMTDEWVAKITNNKYTNLDALKVDFVNEMIKNNLTQYDMMVYSTVVEALEDISEVIELPQEQVDYYYNDIMYYHEQYYENNKALLQLYYNITSFDKYFEAIGLDEKLVLDEAKICSLEDILLVSYAKAAGITLSDDELSTGLAEAAVENGYESADEFLEAYGELYIRTYLIKKKCVDHIVETLGMESDYDTYKHLLESSTDTQ